MHKLTETDIFALLPARAKEAHKGNFGRVTAVCGSRTYRGAAILAVQAALRAGAGIVRLASIEPVIAACAAQTTAAIYLPLAESETGGIAAENARAICEALAPTDVCLVGCGLGASAASENLVARLLTYAPCPLIFDADALRVTSQNTAQLRRSKGDVCITPHLGEFARLIRRTVDEIGANAPFLASEFAKTHGIVVVLKSHITYIASPDGTVVCSDVGNPGLAKGGSGDLLAGLIAGFAAQGHSLFDAACIGVWLAGASADLCAARKSEYAMLPGEQLDDLCTLFLKHGL